MVFGFAYTVGTVRFDGLRDGVLIEAKGPGYASFFNDDLSPKGWYENSGGFAGLVQQMTDQVRASDGSPIQWHVAEDLTARAMQRIIELDPELAGKITIRWTPAR